MEMRSHSECSGRARISAEAVLLLGDTTLTRQNAPEDDSNKTLTTSTVPNVIKERSTKQRVMRKSNQPKIRPEVPMWIAEFPNSQTRPPSRPTRCATQSPPKNRKLPENFSGNDF